MVLGSGITTTDSYSGKEPTRTGRETVIPVDLSRLRLMADAVMNIHPWHYHPGKAAEGPFGGVAAMPLYPLHGLES